LITVDLLRANPEDVEKFNAHKRRPLRDVDGPIKVDLLFQFFQGMATLRLENPSHVLGDKGRELKATENFERK